jgi:hypothetical protein
MGQCLCHPEKESRYLCMKDNVYLCDECLSCRSPSLYCKFRPSCPIRFMEKRSFKDAEPTPLNEVKVTLLPDNKTITVVPGSNLPETAGKLKCI